MLKMIKGDGTVVAFDSDKIAHAVVKAMKAINKVDMVLANRVAAIVKADALMTGNAPDRAWVQRQVKEALMLLQATDVAIEYIEYSAKTDKPDLFRTRVAYRPYEYPNLAEYVQAINHSYWLFSHYNYNSDIQDIKVNMPDDKAETALRAILAISQIEVSVKKFWSKIGDYFPKPEIEEVSATFAESEVRHAQAYSNLLDIMELNNRFAHLTDVPAMRGRINYLRDANTKVLENRDVFRNIILFSMFIENVSLFSQFYVLLKFNKEEKWLNGTANAILATSKEEVIHANFGFDLINTIKKENGQWWTDELKQEIYDAADTALAAEGKVIEWICNGDEDLENEVYNFVCLRMDDSLKAIGLNPQYYKLDGKKEFEWFYTLTESRAAIDFFNSKDPSYTKGDKAVTADDLF